MFKKIKKKKWQLLSGLLFIPIIFLFSLTIMGIICSIIKNWNDLKLFINEGKNVQIILWWSYVLHSFYGILTTICICLIFYVWFAFKILSGKINSKEAIIAKTDKIDFGSGKWLTNIEIDKISKVVMYNQKSKDTGFVFNTKKVKQNIKFNLKDGIHSIIIGSTGSGKTQTIVFPTIYVNAKSTTKPSMIITDLKGEIFETQSQLLKKLGYTIKVLNFRDLTIGNTWNPLELIYLDFKAMLLSKDYQKQIKLKVKFQNEIKSLAKTLTLSNKNLNDPFWDNSAGIIIEAVILGILEDCENQVKIKKLNNEEEILSTIENELPAAKFNLGSVAVITSFKNELIKWFNDKPRNSQAKMIASQLLTSNDGDNKTLDSILMNVANYLEVFKNEFIRNLTAQNDINFNELIEKPLALFIIMPDENSNYSKLISLLISQIYQFLVELANKNQNKSLKRPTYFILDEFGNIPKINNMEKIITIARSRNIYFQLILQDISLLDILYGKDIRRIILNNCGLHIFLHTNDLETAKYYSELFGEETILQVGTSEIKDNTSLSKNLKGKSLISASELLNLPTGVGIAKISRENPIKINLTFWKDLNIVEKGEWKIKNIVFDNFDKIHLHKIKNIKNNNEEDNIKNKWEEQVNEIEYKAKIE